jgi:hypothetical protein
MCLPDSARARASAAAAAAHTSLFPPTRAQSEKNNVLGKEQFLVYM